MMNNVVGFIRHVQSSFTRESKLRSSDFPKLLYELKQLMAGVHETVVIHRQKVTKKKTSNVLYLYCVVFTSCHVKSCDVEPLTWVACDTVFTDEQLEASNEVKFLQSAKQKIPQLLGKCNSACLCIWRQREEN